LIVLLLASCAQAAGAATVCRFVSGGTVVFGPYDALSATPTDTVASFRVRCDRDGGPANVSITLALSAGAHGASVANRALRQVGGSGDLLSYGLYRDTGRTAVWGFSPGVDAMQQTLSIPNKSSAFATFTIYGRLPALQNVSAGSYTDSVQVTLTP
jgi:spore coat protein U-like protein